MMRPHESQGSATILQFPKGGRAATTAARVAADALALAPKMALGDAWYHDAAMQDERDDRH